MHPPSCQQEALLGGTNKLVQRVTLFGGTMNKNTNYDVTIDKEYDNFIFIRSAGSPANCCVLCTNQGNYTVIAGTIQNRWTISLNDNTLSLKPISENFTNYVGVISYRG